MGRHRRRRRKKNTALKAALIITLIVLLGVAAVLCLMVVNEKKSVSPVSDLEINTEGTVQILSWTAKKERWHYEVYQAKDGGEYALMETVYSNTETENESETAEGAIEWKDGKTLSVAVTGLEYGHIYSYKVVTVNEFAGETYRSDGVTVTDVTATAHAPDINVVSDSINSLEITWAPVENITGYVLRYGTSEDMQDAASISILAANVTLNEDGTVCTYNLKELESGTTYYVELQTYKTYTQEGFTDKYYSENTAKAQASTPSYINVQTEGVDSSKPMVALTFDDGPDYDTGAITDRIVDCLEEYGALATFFFVGERAAAMPDVCKRIADNGYEIGNHTYDHSHLGSEVTAEDISKSSDAIEAATGKRPTAFRSPGGETTDLIRQTCVSEGMALYYWSVDTRDWESRDAASVIANVKNSVYDGSIILMHNIYESTAEAVEELVPWLLSEGYQLVTVSQLVYYKTGQAPVAGLQYYDAWSYR